ncbi:MAG: TerC family protein [Planctomycetota bacterium]|nr:TerC family protein [Planctomycetota bacterium]
MTFQNASDLLVLCLMEVVLGIDNIVFIAIITSRLPREQRSKARKIGLLLALVMRIGLLSTINYIAHLKTPVFTLTGLGIPESWLPLEHLSEINGISARDLVLLSGGLFLIGKSVLEMHEQFNVAHQEHSQKKEATFASVLIQIAILDLVFSLDSVIAAVGLADHLWVMITSIIIAVAAMILFANAISEFVEANPTLKMLALSFLILIGVMLVGEGSGAHINKGYIYFAMIFSLVVEFLNIRLRRKTATLPHPSTTQPADDPVQNQEVSGITGFSKNDGDEN